MDIKMETNNISMGDFSDPAIFLVVFVLPVVIVIILVISFKKKSNIDNGPPLVPGIPLLGNIFDVNKKSPHLSLTGLSKTYGCVFRIKMLGRGMVIVNGSEAIREVLIGKEVAFAGRPEFFRITYGFHGSKDIIFGTYCQKWLHMKKIVNQTLRQFAVGSDHVENIVKDEMTSLVEQFDNMSGRDFDPAMFTMTAVVNAISASVMGCRFEHDDPQMVHYKKTTRLFSQACSVTEGLELDMFPWLRFFPNESFRKLTEARGMLDTFVDQVLKERKNKFNPESIECVLDALMLAQNDTSNFKLTDRDIRSIFIDILVSATFTTSVNINAFLLLMAHYPSIQKMLHQEIDLHLGKDRLPTGQERTKMHLMEAAILECLRYISHVPLCLPHLAIEDAKICGYSIKKNSEILLNLWELHHDPNLWDEPWSFNPERFLDSDGHLIPATHPLRKSLLPFGGGRRMCLGEKLARERTFLYLTSILQNFTILPPAHKPLVSCDPREFQLGLILEPASFEIQAKKRVQLADDIIK